MRFDLGPAWVWPQLQPLMAELTQALDVPLFGQQVSGAGLYEDMTTDGPVRLDTPSPHGDSFRIAHGGLSLVEALADRLDPGRILLDCRVTGLVERGERVLVESVEPRLGAQVLEARHVILALPPRLAAHHLRFDPALPPDALSGLRATPTWMAGHAKWMSFYERPFWREQGLSGEVFSRIGPLTEIYDASPVAGGPYALFGFFGLPATTRRQVGEPVLAEHCLAQLGRLFGECATDPVDWRIKDWSADAFTATPDDLVPPAGHPVYGMDPACQVTWSGKLIFSGTETATESGGYLEGALEAGRDAASRVVGQSRQKGER